MIVVRLRTAELIIGNARPKRPIQQILQHSATAIIANDDQQFCGSIVPLAGLSTALLIGVLISLIVIVSFSMPLIVPDLESDHPAIMIAAQRLSGISLESVQLNQITVVTQRIRRRIPNKTVHSISQWLHCPGRERRIRISHGIE